MADHDPLESFARGAGRDIAGPDFGALVDTSKRRRRASLLGAGVAAAVVLGSVTLGMQVADTDSTAPAGPAHPPTTPVASAPSRSPSTSPQPAPSAIVDSPTSLPSSVAVLPDQPAARAVVWSPRSGGQSAVTVTADGFQTRTTLPAAGRFPHVSAAGPNWFFVAQLRASALVSPQGVARPVRVVGSPAPLATGEFLVQAYTDETLAVDPLSATAHPLAVPPTSHEVYGGQDLMWSIAYRVTARAIVHSAIVWSTNGGRSWSSHPLGSGPLAVYTRVPSDDATMVVSLTGDVTVTPLAQVISSDDAGRTWHSTTVHPTVGVSWTAVLPDGRLLANVLGGPHQGPGHFGGYYSGLMSSVGTDWSRLVRVHPALPGGEQETNSTLGELVAMSTSHASVLLFARGNLYSPLLVSTDGGRSWAVAPDR